MTIKINGTNTTAQPSITGTDTDTGLVYGTDEVSIVTGGTDRVTVTNTGMGIGTSSPASLGSGFTEVMISGGTEGAGLQLQDTGGSVKGGMFISNANNAAIIRTITNHPLTFRTNNTERMRISANGNLNVPAVYSFTGPVSANVAVDSDGLLFRATSSIKYKKDVETLADSYADVILNCRPVWYRAKESPSTLPSDWGYWGFIAEEVAEIDPRLVQWKTTEIVQSDDGSLESVACEPTPDGVQYDRFVPHLLNLIKRQQQAIETLETQNASLEARLTALEGGAS